MAKSTITSDPVSEQDKFMLRMPSGMRDRIKAAAEANNRSMNAEIVARLEDGEAASKALIDAVQLLETMRARADDELKVLRWVVDQQNAAAAILEKIAATDGKLDPGFMEALRIMVANKGKDVGFPHLTTDDDDDV